MKLLRRIFPRRCPRCRSTAITTGVGVDPAGTTRTGTHFETTVILEYTQCRTCGITHIDRIRET